MPIYAGIEAGGTSCKVAIADGETHNIIKRHQVPTTTPEDTINALVSWLEGEKFDAIGVGCFGPVGVKEGREDYGFITTTPKPGWQHVDIVGPLKAKFDVPIKFDTDVNAAAYGAFADDDDIHSSAYITVGTGIGGGIMVDGSLVHGMLHPEAGHMFCKRAEGDDFAGTCPFHGDCYEGMAAAGAIAARKGIPSSELPNVPDDDKVWDYTAFYLAQLCANLTFTVSPQRIAIGGGVPQRASLFPKIRAHFAKLINGYVKTDELKDLDTYIVYPPRKENAGLIGAMCLAEHALADAGKKE